jgi:hypothetical protein
MITVQYNSYNNTIKVKTQLYDRCYLVFALETAADYFFSDVHISILILKTTSRWNYNSDLIMVIDFFFHFNRLFIVFSPRSALDCSPYTNINHITDSIICFIAFGLIIFLSRRISYILVDHVLRGPTYNDRGKDKKINYSFYYHHQYVGTYHTRDGLGGLGWTAIP